MKKNVEDYMLSEELFVLEFDVENVKSLFLYFVETKMKYKRLGVENGMMCGYCKKEYEVATNFIDIERFIDELERKYVEIN